MQLAKALTRPSTLLSVLSLPSDLRPGDIEYGARAKYCEPRSEMMVDDRFMTTLSLNHSLEGKNAYPRCLPNKFAISGCEMCP